VLVAIATVTGLIAAGGAMVARRRLQARRT